MNLFVSHDSVEYADTDVTRLCPLLVQRMANGMFTDSVAVPYELLAIILSATLPFTERNAFSLTDDAYTVAKSARPLAIVTDRLGTPVAPTVTVSWLVLFRLSDTSDSLAPPESSWSVATQASDRSCDHSGLSAICSARSSGYASLTLSVRNSCMSSGTWLVRLRSPPRSPSVLRFGRSGPRRSCGGRSWIC